MNNYTVDVSPLKPEKNMGLYVLKAVCALFVVIIHTGGDIRIVSLPMVLSAVPCFYMISGYFLYSNQRMIEVHKAFSWLKKIFIINLLLSVFYSLLPLFYKGDYSFLNKIFQSIFTGYGVTGILWYLGSMMHALILFIVLRYYCSQKVFGILILIAPAFFIFSCLARYAFLYNDNVDVFLPYCYWLNAVTVAVPCVSIGYLFSKYDILQKFKKCFVYLFILLIFLAFAEELFLQYISGTNNMGRYLLMTVPLGVGFFAVMANSSIKFPYFLVQLGKKHSSNIYFFHLLFLAACGSITSKLETLVFLAYLNPFVVFCACWLFSIVLLAICRKVLSIVKGIRWV